MFEPDGTTHVISPCENRIKAQFELWVQNNALKGIAQVEATGDVDQADKLRSAFVGDLGAGHYTWGGKYCSNARFTGRPGFRHLLWLLMARCDPKITEEQVNDLMSKHPTQCGLLMNWALGNSQAPVEAGASNGTGVEVVGVVGKGMKNEQPRQRIVKSPATLD